MNQFSKGVRAGEDLSTVGQYKAVDIDGTIAADTGAYGIAQNKPKNGEDLSILYAGESRYYAGAAVSAGARLTVTTSGYFITAASGDIAVGRAYAAVGSGGIGVGHFNFVGGVAVIA